jgi:large subunit ribosomal protein L18Ae
MWIMLDLLVWWHGGLTMAMQIHEKHPQKVKNFGIWIRYDSRSGTHNMYKEYRETSRTDAVESLYQDMAARHRARFRSVQVCIVHTQRQPLYSINISPQIIKVIEVEKTEDIRRPYIKQLTTKGLKFPLPHRVPKASTKKIFSANRPSTFF